MSEIIFYMNTKAQSKTNHRNNRFIREIKYILNGIITAHKLTSPDKKWIIAKYDIPQSIYIKQIQRFPNSTKVNTVFRIGLEYFIPQYTVLVDQRILGRPLKDFPQFSKYSYREEESFNRFENSENKRILFTFRSKNELLEFLNLLIVLV